MTRFATHQHFFCSYLSFSRLSGTDFDDVRAFRGSYNKKAVPVEGGRLSNQSPGGL